MVYGMLIFSNNTF